MIVFLLFAVVSAPVAFQREFASGPARLRQRAVFARVMSGNRAFDVLIGPLIADSDAGTLQLVFRTIADLRTQHDVDAVERADDAVEGGILAEAALAIGVIDLAVTDKGNALSLIHISEPTRP